MAKCLNCGKELVEYQKHYCSIACQNSYRAKQQREEYDKNPKYCECCGKKLRFEQRMNRYCSSSCAAKVNNHKRIVTEEQKEKTRATLNARYNNGMSRVYTPSDEEFKEIIASSTTWKILGEKLGYKGTNPASNVKENIKERCKKLNIELQIEEMPILMKMTKGAMFDRSKHWTNARIMIQRLAKRNFHNANKETKCAVCGYDKHVDVAHIKAVADFDDSATLEEINNPDNLIGLCPNHHWEYDHGMLDLEKYLKKRSKQ